MRLWINLDLGQFFGIIVEKDAVIKNISSGGLYFIECLIINLKCIEWK